MKQHIASILEAKITVMNYIAEQPEISGMNTDVQKEYLQKRTQNVGFEYMFVADTDCKSYFFNGSKRPQHEDIEMYKNALQYEQYIADPSTREGTDTPITTICTSIYDTTGQKVGLLCGTLSLSALYEELRSMYDEGLTAAITQNGEYVLYENTMSVVKKDNAIETFSDSSEAINFIGKGLSSTATLSGKLRYRNQEYFVAMSDLDYCHWKIIYILDDDYFMGGILNILLLHGTSFLMMLVATFLIFKHQVNAIKTKKLAYQDALTGLGNAKKCHDMINVFDDLEEDIMVVCFDLNSFKKINDTYGHQSGDRALKAFAECLKNSFGTVGFVGRIGGDEFISLIPGNIKTKYDIAVKALNEEIEKFNRSSLESFKLSVSHGCATRTVDEIKTRQINSMLYEADSNMYKSKANYHKENKEDK
ncbi:sensor domain-containing diguanylate cyclase [Oribacterium sp. WCC10]|uniref:sensor domain-containing diguanylate cyclase n=1 Tax=Oribacterium sp. WCC10 TaxID=1855343 RepID=UPI0015871A47|nr:sensor domain-containing diguanylate cyclase [Oribacterium sp. WCC10]